MSSAPGDRAPSLAFLLLRDRLAILAALFGLTLLSWAYLYGLSRGMSGAGTAAMRGMAMAAGFAPWSAADAALMVLMWWVMMIGMMVPSAAPMILTFATVNRKRRARGQPFVPTAVFAAGYLLAWGLFGLAATLAQWALARAALLSPMMAVTSPALGGALCLAAGLYQVTPWKYACLRVCRSPLDFVVNGWRDGKGGALAMGLGHGFYCLGCCWVLMALLFVGGVMNLLLMAALTAFVLIEKLFPAGRWTARLGGAAMVIFGLVMLRSL